MTVQKYTFRFGPCDGETIEIPSPAPARLVIDDSGEILDVSKFPRYPCYVRYLLEHDGVEERFYEYEGEPPVSA